MTKRKDPADLQKRGPKPRYSSSANDLARLQKNIDAYFKSLKPKRGQLRPLAPTIAGLALALGFNSRQAFLEQFDRDDAPELVDAIKKARFLVEAYWEQRLDGQAATGSIFWLKNAQSKRWADTQEVGGPGGGPLLIRTNCLADDEGVDG